jgi:hypothetical protein
MKVKESEIRNCVARHLHLVDPHLTLVKEEFGISFSDGRKAYIDILAKDQYGCLTVIEIKKSDQTARSAIQQMYKYASFLKEKHRIEASKIRCFIVSTTWNELNAPFAEFKKVSDYETKGFELIYDSGEPPGFSEVNPVFIEGNSQPLQNFFHFTFKDRFIRDKTLNSFKIILKQIPSLNHVIFSLNTPAEKSHLGRSYGLDEFPASIALVTFTGNAAFIEEEISKLEPPTLTLDPLILDHLKRWEKAPEAEIRNKIIAQLLLSSDQFGPFKGYAPHSLNNLFSVCDFDIEPIIGGPMFESNLFSVGEAIDMACGVRGLNPYIFNTHITPNRPSHFNSTRIDLNAFLKTNSRWSVALNDLISSLEQMDSLEIQIFNPLNIFGFLNDLAIKETSERLPHLHALLTKENGEKFFYYGTLRWNGRTSHPPILEAIEISYPDLKTFKKRSVINSITEYDEALSRLYDLSYELFDINRELMFDDNEENNWKPVAGLSINNMQDFIDTHNSLIFEIGLFFKEHKIGIGNGTNFVVLNDD